MFYGYPQTTKPATKQALTFESVSCPDETESGLKVLSYLIPSKVKTLNRLARVTATVCVPLVIALQRRRIGNFLMGKPRMNRILGLGSSESWKRDPGA